MAPLDVWIWAWVLFANADWIVQMRMRSHERYMAWSFWYELVYGLSSLLLAAATVWTDRISAGIFLACAAMGFIRWWTNPHNRHRRKKWADRAAGVVRDVGGRLKVVRPATGGAR